MTFSSFANVAAIMDLYAPGSSVTSSVPGGGIETWNGTSMAAPHVAGAWAVTREAAPNATVDEILSALRDTGTLVDDNRAGGLIQNKPRINLDLAAASFAPVATPDTAVTPLNNAVTINVLANDFDQLADPLTITNVGAPGQGTAVQINSTSIQYTPNHNYSGADSFTYTISDNHGNEDTGTVAIIVDPQNVYLPIVLKN